MENSKKMLLCTNTHQLNIDLAVYESKLNYFQDCVKDYSKLGLKPLEEKDLNQIIENPKAFIVKQITHGESLSIGGLKMNPEKLFEIIEKPEGTEDFINKMLSDNSNKDTREYYHWFVDNFIINNKNQVQICPKLSTSITQRHSTYLENEVQQEALEKLSDLCNILDRLNELKTENYFGEDDFLSKIVRKKEGKYEVFLPCVKYFK